MQFQRREFLHFAARAAAVPALLPQISNAVAQPARTSRIVVPFPPGGLTDMLARLLAEKVSAGNARPVIVENRPGGGTIIATEAVARSTPDGTTLLIVGNSFLISANLRKLAYDPLTS